MEIDFLNTLAQYAFLPVARTMGDLTPVYLEEGEKEKMSLLLQCLEKKQLIRMDYDGPLSGADLSAYQGLKVHGSMALTQRGYTVLDILETQGIG